MSYIADRVIVGALAFALAVFPTIASVRNAQAFSPQVRAAVLNYKPPGAASACTNNLSIDGTPQSNSVTSSTGSVTLTTSNSNDVIVAFIWQNGGTLSGSPPISDTAGLTWTQRAVTANAAARIFFAIAASPLVSDVITIHFTTSTTLGIGAFAVSGANTSAPFDPNVALPNVANSGNSSITTTNSCTLPLTFVKGSTGSPGAGAGWTALTNANFTLMEYQKVTVPQSALAGTITSGTSGGTIGDAITQ